MKTIVCVGNTTESIALRSLQIALEYNVPCHGLATSSQVTPGLWVKEFVMFTPSVFTQQFHQNVQTLLENHWQWLYGPRRPEYYHTVYTQL